MSARFRKGTEIRTKDGIMGTAGQVGFIQCRCEKTKQPKKQWYEVIFPARRILLRADEILRVTP